ncbi:LysR family transcriptional regulator [Streptomyces sp. NPDC012769]|uniref:helix-turn-helix domain-containing protein n=1 Tax=Streptomyces sp. NPDC012769 TaxID=3364848 RepID=UPI0036951C3C
MLAAEELGIAQPSLSHTIARLEGEPGTPLFDRGGRLRLNDAGPRRLLDRLPRGGLTPKVVCKGTGRVPSPTSSGTAICRPPPG